MAAVFRKLTCHNRYLHNGLENRDYCRNGTGDNIASTDKDDESNRHGGIVLIQLGSICRDGQALLIFCLSLIYIFLYSMILYMLRRDRKRRIPYIPFLFLAYLTTWMI